MIKFNIFSAEPYINIGSKNFYTFKEASKILDRKGLGQNNLLKLLRENQMLSKYNEPLEEWINSGFFKVSGNRYNTTLISSYCINYIRENFI